MPRRPLTPCTTPGCPSLTPGGPCLEHRRTRDRLRPSAARRGYDHEWNKIRAKHLDAYPTCQQCGSPDTPQVDHILPLTRGGTNTPGNLQTLCRSCHSRKTVTTDGGFGR